jgi:exopolysaccharide production protein ExoQ
MPRRYRKFRKKAKFVENLHYAFDIFAFLLLVSALDFLFYQVFGGRAENFGEVNGPRLMVSIGVYAIGLMLSFYRLMAIKKIFLNNLFFIPIFFLPLVSTIWSVDPGITIFRATAYLLSCTFGLYIISSMSPEEFFRKAMVATFIGGVLSLAWTVINPSDAIHMGGPNNGAWKGVYGQKNELGRIASIAIMMSYFAQPENVWQKYVRWANIGIYLFLVIMSDSKTNWLTLFAMLGFVPLTHWLRNPLTSPSLRIFAVAAGAAALTALVLANSSLILAAMGRDDTFSGRGTLWSGVSAIIASKYPVLGAGYGAFFTDAGGVWDLKTYLRYWTSLPNHAHNGFLSVQADMGYPGLITLVLFLIHCGYRLLIKMIVDPDRQVWAGFSALLFLFVINNISESNAFVHSDIPWIMLLVGYGYSASTAGVLGLKKKRRKFRFKSWAPAKTA